LVVCHLSLHLLRRGVPLALQREQARDVLLDLTHARRVLERAGRVLEAQVEELLTAVAQRLDDLVVGELADLTGLQRDPPPASRTSPSPAASWPPAGSPRAPAARARRRARTSRGRA